MLATGEKAEIQVGVSLVMALFSTLVTVFTFNCDQALSSFGFQFITEEYLPRKLREGDWI